MAWGWETRIRQLLHGNLSVPVAKLVRRSGAPEQAVRTVLQKLESRNEGYLVRDLIAYGEHWYPWYMRRLAERPANVMFALRQMIG